MEDYLKRSHVCKIGNQSFGKDDLLDQDAAPGRDDIEPWFSALLQAEHCSLLLGSGFTIGACNLIETPAPSMAAEIKLDDDGLERAIEREATESAELLGRSPANLEDLLRTAMAVQSGLRIIGEEAQESQVAKWISSALQSLVDGVLTAERQFTDTTNERLREAEIILGSFLMSFAQRTPTRDRLHVFTTNYDRLIERVCDMSGIRMMDRFVGALSPRFRSSRLNVDLHYNPPGIRGEPRLLGGVVRLSKLHGSIDWVWRSGWVERTPLAFGSAKGVDADTVLVYPNSYKDYETAFFPYAELFRDFSAAIVRPNSVVITYGYGFGDDHINRVLSDMLSLPSTHLIIISYDHASGRVVRFIRDQTERDQISLLLGSHFGDLKNLATRLLPQPSMSDVWIRRKRLMDDRGENYGSGRGQ